MPRLVFLSDTHLAHEVVPLEVPPGDILVHSGDATRRGELPEIERFAAWFRAFPHPHKVFVAGNHDWGFQREPAAAEALLGPEVHYLRDAEVTLEGLRIWGSPWQPEFCNWAFSLPRGTELRERWRACPAGVDVLVTHGPPYGIGDRTFLGQRVGCEDLLEEVLTRIRPRVHAFGHIHEAYGRVEQDGTVFLNASNVNLRYRTAHEPHVVDLEAR